MTSFLKNIRGGVASLDHPYTLGRKSNGPIA